MTCHFKEEPTTFWHCSSQGHHPRYCCTSFLIPFEVFFTPLDLLCWPGIATHSFFDHCYIKVWFYIVLYPVRWTAQSALHFPPLADLFIPTPFSASLGSILAMQQLRNDYSLTFPPLSIARYSFIQLSRLRRREVKENAQTSKR